MIEITEVKKEVISPGKETSFYKVTYRANGTLLYQYMSLNNELPDNILMLELSRIAKNHIKF